MRILLINPPFRTDTATSIFRPDMPRNLIVLAGCLRANNFEVKIHDMPIQNLGYETIPEAIASFKPELLCVGVHAACFFPRVKKCLEFIQAKHPNLPVVSGGIVPSMLKERVFSILPEVDIIVLGEGEDAIVEVARAIAGEHSLEDVRGILIKRKDGSIIETRERLLNEDLNRFPMPAYDLIPMEKYRELKLPLFIETQRGCPYNCKFCGANFPSWKGKVRYRDPIKVIDEIEYVVKNFGITKVSFCDETFTLNREKVVVMLNCLMKRNLGITWLCLTRVDRLDEEILLLMKKAGCEEIGLGIEAGSQESLTELNKKTTIDQNEKAIRMIEATGIRARAFIVIGFPNATHADIRATLELLIKARPSSTTFFIFTPTPGTEYFSSPERFGLSLENHNIEDWMKFDYFDVPLSDTPNLSKEDIIRYYNLYSYIIPSKFNPKSGFNEQAIIRLLDNKIPRLKQGVVLLSDGQDYFYYNPNPPAGMQKMDVFRSTFVISQQEYEILLRSNGDFTLKEIASTISKLFDLHEEDAERFVTAYVKKCESLNLIHKLISRCGDSYKVKSRLSLPVE